MANTKQARKRAIQSVARNKHLSAQRSRYRTAIKSVRKAIATGDKAAAQQPFDRIYQGNGLIIRTNSLRGPTRSLFSCVFATNAMK